MSRGGYAPAYSRYVAAADFASNVEVTCAFTKPCNTFTICAVSDLLIEVDIASGIPVISGTTDAQGWLYNIKAGAVVVIQADREISTLYIINQAGAAGAFTITGELVTAF